MRYSIKKVLLSVVLTLSISLLLIVILSGEVCAEDPVDYIIIRDSPGGGGSPVGSMEVPVGTNITGYAAAYNKTTDYLYDVESTWAVENTSGAEAYTSPAAGTNSTFNAGMKGGTATWMVEYNGVAIQETFTITPPGVDYILIRDQTNGEGQEIEDMTVDVGYSKTGYAAGYNNTVGYIYDVESTWSVENNLSESYTSPAAGTNSTFYSGIKEGNATWMVEYNGMNYTVMFTVNPPGLDYILIMDAPDNTGSMVSDMNVQVDHSMTYYAAGFNTSGGYISDISVSWTVINQDGAEATRTPSTGTSTTFNAGTKTGTSRLRAEAEGKARSVIFTITPGPTSTVVISPAPNATVSAGENLTFTAEAYDHYGHLVIDDVTYFTWQNATNGTFNQNTAGEYNVTAEIDGIKSLPTTVTVTQTGIAASVVIYPAPNATVSAGENLTFTAEAFDAYGNLITSDVGEFTWSNATSGVFYNETAGIYVVAATYQNITSNYTMVEVVAASVETIFIHPFPSAQASAGENLTFTIEAFDVYGNLNTTDPALFTWANATNGVFYSEVLGEYNVTASMDGITSDPTLVTVVHGTAAIIEILPSPEENITAGVNLVFSATAYDAFGNFITSYVEEFTWANATAGIFNKTTAGQYNVTATLDGATSPATIVNVLYGTVETVTIGPSGAVETTAGVQLNFTAEAHDAYGNLISDDVGEFNWTGAVAGVFYNETTGTYNVSASYNGVSSSITTVTVIPGPVDTVTINSSYTDPVEAGETIEFTAEAYDAYGNLITDNTEYFLWANATAGIFAETMVGTYNVTAEYDGVTSSPYTVTVIPGPVDAVTITPAPTATLEAGVQLNFTAEAYDAYGNLISDDVGEFNWTGAVAGVFYNETTGTYNVSASYNGVSSSITVVTVTHTSVDSVTITPWPTALVGEGEDIIFTAEAYDAYGNMITDDVANFTWANATDGVFNEAVSGEYNVTATLDGVLSNPTIVNVTAIHEIIITPSPGTTTAGQEITLAAAAYDVYGTLVTDDPENFTWSTGSNIFYQETAGNYTVAATYGGITNSTIITVTPAGVDSVVIAPSPVASVEAGLNLSFTAEAFDEFGNLVTDVVTDFTWENALNGVFNEGIVGDYDVNATYDNGVNPPVTSLITVVSVTPGPVATVTIGPAPTAEVVAGVNLVFTVEALDEFGNLVDDNVANFTWQNAVAGVFNEETVGDYDVTATYDDGVDPSVTSDITVVTVTHAPVASVVIAPSSTATVNVGQALFFTAEAYDEYGNLIEDDVMEFIWTNATNGEFSETLAGDYAVTASYGLATSTITTVTVLPPTVDYILVRNASGGEGDVLVDSVVVVGFSQMGYAAGYNDTVGYLYDVVADWAVDNVGGASASTAPAAGTNSTLDVGLSGGTAFWNASYNDGATLYNYTITITILSPTVDYILVRDASGGEGDVLVDSVVVVGFSQMGYAAGYNDTVGYLYDVVADWAVDNVGGASASTAPAAGTNSTLDVGLSGGTAFWNASYNDGADLHEYAVNITILSPTVDYIQIRDASGGEGDIIGPATLYNHTLVVGYAAGYNYTAVYIGDQEAAWSVNNTGAEATTSPAMGTTSTLNTGGSAGTAEWIIEYNGISNSTIFTVTGDPDAVVLSLWGPEEFLDDANVNFTATIRNDGLSPITEGMVYFYYDEIDPSKIIGDPIPLVQGDPIGIGETVLITSSQWNVGTMLTDLGVWWLELEIFVWVNVTEPHENITDNNMGIHIVQINARPAYITSTSPMHGEEAPVDTLVTLEFTKPMDKNTVQEAFSLYSEGAEIDGTFTWPNDWTMVFTPLSLLHGEEYTVKLIDTAIDIYGMRLDGNNDTIPGGDMLYSFTTAAEEDTWGPEVTNLAIDILPEEHINLTATIDDTNTGGSTITGAYYSLNIFGPWTPMNSLAWTNTSTQNFYAVIDITSLANSTNHQIFVRGEDSQGNMGDIYSISFYKADGNHPTNEHGDPWEGILNAQDLEYGGAVEISWKAAMDNAMPITYVIYASTGLPLFIEANIVYQYTDHSSLPGTLLQHTITGLENDITHRIGIWAVDIDGNTAETTSYTSIIPTDTQIPYWTHPVLVVDETGEDGSILLQWTAANDANTAPGSAITYQVYRSGNKVAALSGHTFTDTAANGIIVGQTYDYTIRAVDNSGNFAEIGPESATSIDDLAPRFDSNTLTAEDTGEGRRILLEWDAAEDASPITYKIYYSTNLFTPEESNLLAEVNTTEYLALVEYNNVQYHFMVRPVDSSGNEYSGIYYVTATATDTTPPEFNGLSSAVGTGEYGAVELSWAPATDNTGPIWYILYYSSTENLWNEQNIHGIWHEDSIQIDGQGNYSLLVQGLENGQLYHFGIRAADSAGNTDANTISHTATPMDTVAPEFLGLREATPAPEGGEIILEWDAAKDASEEYGHHITYEIYIHSQEENITLYLLDTTTHLQYRILEDTEGNPMENGKTYHFLVRAVDAEGNTDGNNIILNATPMDTVAPDFAGLEHAESLPQGGAVQLSWLPAEDRYPVTYTVYKSSASSNLGSGDFNELATGITATAYTATGLEDGKTYHFHVKAIDTTGNTDGNNIVLSVTPVDTQPPVFEGITEAIDLGYGGAIQIAWDAAEGSAGYNIYRSTSQTFIPGPANLVAQGITQLQYTDTGLVNGILYHYTVRAVDAAGNMEQNTRRRSATPTDTVPPTFPGIEIIKDQEIGGTLLLEWDAAEDTNTAPGQEIIYRIYRHTTSNVPTSPYSIYHVGTTTQLSFMDTSLQDGITYYYRVRAVDTSGNTDDSRIVVSATPTRPDNSAPGLSPMEPMPLERRGATNMVFKVIYRDMDGDPPEYVALVINGEEKEMYPLGTNRDYKEGVIYEYALTLQPGEYTYQFTTVDNPGETTNQPSKTFTTTDRTLTIQEITEDEVLTTFLDETYYGITVLIWLLLIFMVIMALIALAVSGKKKKADASPETTIDCPTCSSKLRIETAERPVEIECPTCNTQLRIT